MTSKSRANPRVRYRAGRKIKLVDGRVGRFRNFPELRCDSREGRPGAGDGGKLADRSSGVTVARWIIEHVRGTSALTDGSVITVIPASLELLPR